MEERLVSLEIPKDVNKREVARLAKNVVLNAIDEERVLDIAEGLSVMDKLIEAVRKDDQFIDAIVTQLERNNGHLVTSNGSKIEKVEVAVRYDYSHNQQWVELDEQIKQLTHQKKQLEESLKRLGAGKLLVDENTGETFSGAAKASKTSYKITLAK